jgi:hypothetical protein
MAKRAQKPKKKREQPWMEAARAKLRAKAPMRDDPRAPPPHPGSTADPAPRAASPAQVWRSTHTRCGAAPSLFRATPRFPGVSTWHPACHDLSSRAAFPAPGGVLT